MKRKVAICLTGIISSTSTLGVLAKDLDNTNLGGVISASKDRVKDLSKSNVMAGYTVNAGASIPGEFDSATQAKITSFVNNEGTWYYYLNDGNYAVLVDYVGTATEITIPQQVDGYTVTEILGAEHPNYSDSYGLLNTNNTVQVINITHNITLGKGALKNAGNVRTLNGTENITYVGDYALYNLSRLEGSLNLSNSTYLGDYALASSGMSELLLNSNTHTIPIGFINNARNLVKVTGLGDVLEVCDYAFKDTVNIQDIDIDFTNLSSIDNYAFVNCTWIRGILDISSAGTLGANAFNGCKNITGVKLSSKLRLLENDVFRLCDSLGNIDFTSENIDSWGAGALARVGFSLTDNDNKVNLNLRGTLGNDAFTFSKLGIVTIIDAVGVANSSSYFRGASIDKLVLTDSAVQSSTDLLRNGFNNATIKELVIPDGAVIDNIFNESGLTINKITFEGTATITNSFNNLKDATETVVRGVPNKVINITDSFSNVNHLVKFNCTGDVQGSSLSDHEFKYNIRSNGKLEITMSRFSDETEVIVNGENVINSHIDTNNPNGRDFGLVKVDYLNGNSNIQVNILDGELLFGKDGSVLRRATESVGKYYKRLGMQIDESYTYNLIRDIIAPTIPYYTIVTEDLFTWTLSDNINNNVVKGLPGYTLDFQGGLYDFDVTSFEVTQPVDLEYNTNINVTGRVFGAFMDSVKIVVKDNNGNIVGELLNTTDNNFAGNINIKDSIGGLSNYVTGLTYELVDISSNKVLLTETKNAIVQKYMLAVEGNKTITKVFDGKLDANVTLDDLDIKYMLPTDVNKEDIIEITGATYDSADGGDSKTVTVSLVSKSTVYDVPNTITVNGSITAGTGEIKEGDVVYNNQATYGDTIEIKVKPSVVTTYSNRTIDTVELYKGNNLLATSTRKDGDYYVIEYNTVDKKLDIGENNLTLKFTGNDSLLATTTEITVTLTPLSLNATYDLSYNYDGLTEKETQLNVTGLLNNDTVDTSIVLTLDENSINVGGTPIVLRKTYNINNKYYTLDESNISGNINISKADVNNIQGNNIYTQQVKITNKLNKTYNINIPLDSIFDKSYGAVTYSVPTLNEQVSGYFNNGVQINGDTISFEINDVDSKNEQVIGNIGLVITSTNFNDVTYTVEVSSSNKVVPVVNISPLVVEYGTEINGDSFNYTAEDGNNSLVIGTLQVTGGGILDVGTYTLTVTFVPYDTNLYDTVEVQVPVTINKASITMQKPPTISEPNKVDNILGDFSFVDNGEFVDKEGDIIAGGTLEWVSPDDKVITNNKYGFIFNHPNYEFTGTLVPYPTGNIPIKLPSGATTVFPDGSLIVGKTDVEIDGNGNVKVSGQVDIQLTSGDSIKINHSIVEFPNGTIITLPSNEIATFDKDKNLVLPSGSKYPTNNGIAELPNGGIVLPDGTIRPNFPILVVTPGGDLLLPDSTVIPNNPGYTKDTNGNVIIAVTGGVLDNLLDGGNIILRPDGTISYESLAKKEEVKLPNGGTLIGGNLTGTVIQPGDKVESIGKPDIDKDGNITLPNGGIISKPDGSQVILPVGIVIKPNMSNNNNIDGSSNSSSSAVINKTENINGDVINTNGNDINTNIKDTNIGVNVDGSTKDTFVDISNSWYTESINELQNLGIVDGYLDGTFRPDANITRADFSIMVYNILEKEYNLDVNGLGLDITYKDIDENSYYSDKVKSLSYLGIIQGYGDSTFKPTNNITREEASIIISRLVDYLGKETTSIGISAEDFVDYNNISKWAKKDVDKVAQKGLIRGYEDKTFKPKNNITRAETVQLLYNVLNI